MYAKGEKPRDLEAAKGGAVLGRTREFTKECVEFREPEEGKMEKPGYLTGDTADDDQKYAKSGIGSGKGDGPALKDVSKGETKVLKTVKPRS